MDDCKCIYIEDDLENSVLCDTCKAAFDGLEYSYKKMDEEIQAMAPICHFTKMNYEYGDNYGDPNWWECTHCGHTKDEK